MALLHLGTIRTALPQLRPRPAISILFSRPSVDSSKPVSSCLVSSVRVCRCVSVLYLVGTYLLVLVMDFQFLDCLISISIPIWTWNKICLTAFIVKSNIPELASLTRTDIYAHTYDSIQVASRSASQSVSQPSCRDT